MLLLARIRRSLRRPAGRCATSAALALFFAAVWHEGARCRCPMDGGMRPGTELAGGAHVGMAMAAMSGDGARMSGHDRLVASHPSDCGDSGCCGCLGTCQGAGPLPTPTPIGLLHVAATQRAKLPSIRQAPLRSTSLRLIPPAIPPPTLA